LNLRQGKERTAFTYQEGKCFGALRRRREQISLLPPGWEKGKSEGKRSEASGGARSRIPLFPEKKQSVHDWGTWKKKKKMSELSLFMRKKKKERKGHRRENKFCLLSKGTHTASSRRRRVTPLDPPSLRKKKGRRRERKDSTKK